MSSLGSGTVTMPPFIPSTRKLSTPPPGKRSKAKPSLFEAADKRSASKKTLQDNKRFLEKLNNSDDDTSLSEISSGRVEHSLSPAPKRRKLTGDEDAKGEDDDEVDWEDAIEHPTAPTLTAPAGISGDLELTLDENAHYVGSLRNLHNQKKGPSKIEREIRLSTHRMHVQFLLFHNLMRSRWAADKKVQEVLVAQLPEQMRVQVDKWRVDSGLRPETMMSQPKKSVPRGKKREKKASSERYQREWGKPAERQEKGEPNMSSGDPIIRLCKFLCAYWRKRYTITAPGLRKEGYKSLAAIEQEVASMRKDRHDPVAHGERIDGIEGFRKAATMCEGSRDLGAQLFTALLRGLGIEARLVASLQPLGFGWSKNEEASTKKEKSSSKSKEHGAQNISTSENESDGDSPGSAGIYVASQKARRPSQPAKRSRKSRGAEDSPIHLSEDTNASNGGSDDDDESVVEITPQISREKSNISYDHDLPAPNYWIEVISPITHQVYPVDPLVSKVPIVTSPEYLSQFEPRGARADKAKQVFAYVIAYSADGTAKDVTTRYLKRHVWPGRTKGFRMPIEKVPVYNRKGKIKRYEAYDWFKTIISGYERSYSRRTAVDDLEEERDLKPARFEKKEVNVREDTLQFYKTSADFVLERHLRREEAFKPGSKPVRTFKSGKGDNIKEEPVYRRQDVEVCRTGESWHKEGRAVKPGEQPMKMVPIRAVTLTRKREVEEAERDSGEKQKQGLYAGDQTDWIIPPPIENGRIPKNAYGNIDCFVPTMVPKGAVHVPLRKTVMICKKLGIDYAEAVTGFEFGNKMAVPVINGVVIASQHEDLVLDQWEKDEQERRIKEEGKRAKMALATWRKWLMGLRIIQRVREEYGGNADAHMKEEMNPFTNQSNARKQRSVEPAPNNKQGDQVLVDADNDREEGAGGFTLDSGDEHGAADGGFFPEGYDEYEVLQPKGKLGTEDKRQADKSSVRGLAALTTAIEGQDGETDSSLPTPSDIGEESDPDPPRSMTVRKGNVPRQSAHRMAATPQNPSMNGRKRKTVHPINSDGAEAAASDLKATRSVPKRKAARKSETAVKSHYFDHSSADDGGDSGSHDAVSESKSTEVEQSIRKRPGRPPGSAKKSGLVRKRK